MTQYIGLIGYPLGHSVSPVFQQAALDHYGLDVRYRAWETPPEELQDVVNSLHLQERLGMNVTIPYKQDVLPLLTFTDDAATAIGAVNTIAKDDGRLMGYNTDAPGFLRALTDDAGLDPKGARVLVLGGGGAARGVVYGLITAEAGFISVAGRTGKRIRIMVESFMGVAREHGVRITIGEWRREGLAQALGWYDIVINATPLGMRGGPEPDSSPLEGIDIPPKTFVCDLVYNPTETPLLRQARAAGCAVLGGLPMLVYQGAAAFERWTGRNAPTDVMFAAARSALGDTE